MASFCAQGAALLTLLSLTSVLATAAQHESFRHVPNDELMPVTTAYGLALDSYAAENWMASVTFLELSLRLYRLLKDSARYCSLHCDRSNHDGAPVAESQHLRVHWRVMMRALCQQKCRAHFPALQLPLPGREILEDFSRRSPYRYLHFAYARLNDLQRAVPCAYTFLQRNPQDQELQQIMQDYKSQYDLSGYLTDYEEQPHEASFLKGVKLTSSSDYSSGIEHLEDALRLYMRAHDLCQADCEGLGHLSPDRDLYTALADVYVDVLRCKLRCEERLQPNVGGYLVEKFVATVYHHLQFAYYKLNDGRRAVPCAHSYILFEPEDQVMKQNLLYYSTYSEEWGLRSEHFSPRTEALQHHNQTVTQKQMLAFAEKYLELEAEDFLGPEEAARLATESPDAEFEGVGDYEESFYSNWRQEKGKGDAGESES